MHAERGHARDLLPVGDLRVDDAVARVAARADGLRVLDGAQHPVAGSVADGVDGDLHARPVGLKDERVKRLLRVIHDAAGLRIVGIRGAQEGRAGAEGSIADQLERADAEALVAPARRIAGLQKSGQLRLRGQQALLGDAGGQFAFVRQGAVDGDDILKGEAGKVVRLDGGDAVTAHGTEREQQALADALPVQRGDERGDEADRVFAQHAGRPPERVDIDMAAFDGYGGI